MGEVWLAGWRPYLLLAALCLCLYLPGLSAIPVLDRDEARFAQATRQMLDTGDFLDIRFQEEARNNKPAGIYWLQAASVGALSTPRSTAIWPYRLPSLVGATLAVLLVFGFGRHFLGGPCAALIAATLLAAALGTIAEAHIAKTDAALLAAIAAAQGALGLAYLRARAGQRAGPGIAAVFWLAEIAAIYLKGPIGPGLAAATAATLSVADRDARWLRGLRPAIGLAVTALAVAPWLYAIQHATEGQFLKQSVGHDFMAKVFGAQEAHGMPPLYYTALALLTFWPGSLFLAPALVDGWRARREPAVRFLLAWLIPAWVVLELVPTKLPHYALPLTPALALLAAKALMDKAATPRRLAVANAALWLVVTLTLAAGLIVGPLRLGDGISVAGNAGAAIMVLLAAALLFARPGPGGTAALLAALALAFVVPAATAVVPGLDRLWLSRATAAMIARHPPAPGAKLAAIGYNEPSLVFLLDDKLKAQTADVPVAIGSEALVANKDVAVFERTTAEQGLAAQAVDSVGGTNYSNGQRMVLTLYRIVPQ